MITIVENPYYGRLMNLAKSKYWLGEEDAEDCVCDTISYCMRNFHKYDPVRSKDNIFVWYSLILSRFALDFKKKTKRLEKINNCLPLSFASDVGVEDSYDENVSTVAGYPASEEFIKWVKNLPPQQRKLVGMLILEPHESNEYYAEKMKISVFTLKRHKQIIRRKLSK